jgi:hypothetical protein
VLVCSLAVASVATAQEPPLGGPRDNSLFSLDTPLGPVDYVPGRGLRLGRTGLTLGGFTTAEFDLTDGQPGTVAIDGLNFLALWEPVEFFHAFAEVELGPLLFVDTGSGDVRSSGDAHVERLYGDLSKSDALNLRVGKFQTPVGIWNLVPAEPFTWTATDPVLAETAFDEHQTGAAFYGSLYPGHETLDYWVYGQFVDALDPSDDPSPSQRSVGGRLRYAGPFGRWDVGSSFLASEQGADWNFLGGLDGLWRIGHLELQGEFAIVSGDIPGRDLWGLYLQGEYDLGSLSSLLRGLHAVGRYEHFDREGPDPAVDLGDLGLAWMPRRFLIVKADYRLASHQTPDVRRGLFSSISVIF